MSLIDSFWTKTNELASSAVNSASRLVTSAVDGVFSNIAPPSASGASGGSTDPSLQNRKYTVRIAQNQNVIVGAVPETIELNQSANWSAPWAGGISGTKGDLLAAGLGTRLVAQVLTLQVWQGGGNNDFDFSIQFELRAYSDPERDVMVPLRVLLGMAMPSLSSNGFLQAPGPALSKEGLQAFGAGAGAVLGKAGELGVRAAKAAGSSIAGMLSGSSDIAAGKMADGNLTSVFESISNGTNELATTAQNAGFTRKAIEEKMQNKIKIEIGDWFRLTNVVVTDVRHTLKSQRPGKQDGTLMAADVVVSFRPMFTLTAEDIPQLLGKYQS